MAEEQDTFWNPNPAGIISEADAEDFEEADGEKAASHAPTTEGLNDDLVRRALDGDSISQDVLVKHSLRYTAAVLQHNYENILRRMPHISADDLASRIVADLVSDNLAGFRSLMQARQIQSPCGFFVSCLKKRIHCRMIDEMRKHDRRPGAPSDQEAAEDALANAGAQTPDAMVETINNETRRAFDECLLALSLREQEILKMKLLEGRSSREICAELKARFGDDLSEGAVNVAFTRSKKTLKIMLMKKGINP